MFCLNLTNGAMEKWGMIKWCNGEIKNGTGHFFSHKYWICLFVLFLKTTFSLIIKNKQNLIRYCNASSFVVVFRKGKTEKYVNILSIIATLSPSESRHRCLCWYLVVVFGVSDSAHCCQIIRRWRLIVVDVSSLSAEASLIVAESMGLCAFSSSLLLLGILLLAASRCCSGCRLLVIGVVVVECIIVDGVFLLLLLSSCCYPCCCRWRRLFVVVVGGVAAFSEIISLY